MYFLSFTPKIALFSAHRAGAYSTRRHFPPKIRESAEIRLFLPTFKRKELLLSPYRPIAMHPFQRRITSAENERQRYNFRSLPFSFSAHRGTAHFAPLHTRR